MLLYKTPVAALSDAYTTLPFDVLRVGGYLIASGLNRGLDSIYGLEEALSISSVC